MASVLNVAAYILNKMGEITTMKLQKLVYYCQAWSLAWDDKPLFNERIEAWANGPVCPELFYQHKGRFVLDQHFLRKYENYPFTEEEKNTMKEVLNYYGDKDSQWLSDLTHQEEPWKMARANVPAGKRCNAEITKESMQEYYGGL